MRKLLDETKNISIGDLFTLVKNNPNYHTETIAINNDIRHDECLYVLIKVGDSYAWAEYDREYFIGDNARLWAKLRSKFKILGYSNALSILHHGLDIFKTVNSKSVECIVSERGSYFVLINIYMNDILDSYIGKRWIPDDFDRYEVLRYCDLLKKDDNVAILCVTTNNRGNMSYNTIIVDLKGEKNE